MQTEKGIGGLGKGALLSLLAWAATTPCLGQGSHHYLYLSDKRIITVELIDAQTVILNYFNLDDAIAFLNAPHVLVKDAAGDLYRGQVFEIEGAEAAKRYAVNQLVMGREYSGLTILGRFDFKAPPAEAMVLIGGRYFELEPQSGSDFELVASRVGELDFSVQDGKAMVELAGFREGHGLMIEPATDEAQALAPLFPELDLLPPIVVVEPRPRLPQAHSSLPDPVVVQLSAGVTRAGGIVNIEVKRGVNPQLDRLAVAVVTNSWKVLPAISKGEVVDSIATLNVVFDREEGN